MLPSVPAHVMVNVVFAVRAGVVKVPLVFTAPDQTPLGELVAVQVVVLVVVQVNVAVAPDVTLVGLALIVAVAGGGAVCTNME